MALADRSLIDALAVTAAGLEHPDTPLARQLGVGGRIAMLAHLIDYDNLHVPTRHISAVCIAAALASGGGAEAYLAGAGVMARLGAMLGWSHYEAGWYATCTAGAPAAAVVAGIALGLDTTDLRTAMALAVPAAGGVNRAFGTAAKSLQVGFAVDAGVRAATLAAAGASADGRVLKQWLTLVGGETRDLPTTQRFRADWRRRRIHAAMRCSGRSLRCSTPRVTACRRPSACERSRCAHRP
jgi:2-methylcitrate dehydratase PrpD